MAVTTTFSNTQTVAQFGANDFTTGNQLLPDALGLDNGGWVTAYNSAGNFILLNFYDADSNAVGGFRIPYDVAADTEAIGKPSLTKLANGNVLVVWDNDGPAGSQRLEGRIFTQTGLTVGGELPLSGQSLSFEDPVVSALPGGGFIISFTFGGNVFFGRYGAAGGQIGGFTQVNTVGVAGTQNDAHVAVLADGGWVVTYTDTNIADQPLRATVYNADGTVRTADFLIDGIGDNTQSALHALPNGNFAVVYTDSGWAEGGTLGNGITLRIYNANGGAVTGFIKVNTTSTVDEREPDITILENGYIVVTWTRPLGGAVDDIFARVFDQNGNALTGALATEFAIAADGGDVDRDSAVAALFQGDFVTTWQDSDTLDGSGGRITAEVNRITRTSNGDGADDTIMIDQLIDIASGNGGNDTFQGGGVRSFDGDTINGGLDNDRILATDDVSLVNTTLSSIEEIEMLASGGAKAVTIRADQVGAGLASNLLLDFSAIGTADTFTVQMLADTSVDLSQFGVQDFFEASGENDRIFVIGDSDNETIRGTSVRDDIFGNGGNDVIEGGPGGDLIDGGLGSDRVTYANAAAGVVANLSNAAANTGDAAGDIYVSIEHMTGSAFNDTLTGTGTTNSILGGNGNDEIFGLGGNDSLFGNDGNDIIHGGAGADSMSGGAGSDRASYATAAAAVIANLSSPAGNAGDAAGDTYSSIENLTGSAFNDTLTGNSGTNSILGGDGNDEIFGLGGNDSLFGNDGNDIIHGGAGADSMSGGAGSDRASYATAAAAVIANLSSPAGNAGDAAGDTYSSIENLTGSAFNDTLTGNSGTNSILGGDGNDEIFGLGGNDSLFGNDGNDIIHGGAGADSMSGGAGTDRVSYATAGAGVVASLVNPAGNTGDAAGDTYASIENLTGSAFNDTLTGNSGTNSIIGGDGNDTISGLGGNDSIFGNDGNDVLHGGAGADSLSGGTGTDTASYQTAAAGVVASLTTPATNAGDAAGDTYSSIENLRGSNFNDTLTGNSVANVIEGLNGNDTINGRAGNDTLTGNAGNDTFVFDTALGATNIDTITDFNFVQDTIQLENAIFNAIVGVGTLSANQFVANATGTATLATHRIIYNTSNGELTYDTNGSAAGGGQIFAILDPGLGITNNDFVIV